VPLVSVIGSIACSLLWGLILVFHEGGRILGTAWVFVGVVCFLIFRTTKKLPVMGSSSGKRILPGGYVMNAVVLVRTPEDEKAIASSIEEAFDPRFRITLLNVLDPVDFGLSTDKLSDFSQIKAYQEKSIEDLQGIAKRLRAAGYQSVPRVEIGSFRDIIEESASSDRNDMVVIITRKARRGHIEKTREDSAQRVLSKYPGKIMIIRRPD
jgi:nucleotide-binding universal stress UspA family protein